MNGKPLEKQRKYRVTVLDKYTFFKTVAKTADARHGADAYVRSKQIVRKDWLAYFKAGKPLLEPTHYLKIIEN